MALSYDEWLLSQVAETLAARLAPQLQELKDDLMSQLTPRLDALESAVTAAEARVSGDLAGLKQQIADLQARADAGTATDAELARLDSLTARVAAIDAPAPAPTTDPGPAPAPEPAPAPDQPADPNAPAPTDAPANPQ